MFAVNYYELLYTNERKTAETIIFYILIAKPNEIFFIVTESSIPFFIHFFNDIVLHRTQLTSFWFITNSFSK